MTYEQREREVERVRDALDKASDISAPALARYTDNQAEELRRDLYALYWRMGTASREQPRRAGFVEYLVSRTPVEIAGLRGQLLKWLQDFRKDDYNNVALATLTAFPWTPDYTPDVIRLTGIVGGSQAEVRLKAEVARQPLPEPPPAGYHGTNTWAALLALARLGDEAALKTVIARVRAEQDIVMRSTILFEDLGYTMRPAAFDVLREYLNSDSRLPRIKDNVPGTMEASRAAAVLSKYIRGFPIQETDFSEPQTMQARSWANSQTTWQFK